MFETNSGNLIQKSEALAQQEIDKLSNLYGEVLTKKEIIERIREINKSIALYDLLIESDTFSKLISVTNLNFPRVKDRIYSALLYLYSKFDQKSKNKTEAKQVINYIEYAATLIFSWDRELSKEITSTIKDLAKFVNCKDNKQLQSCTLEMIKKYKFRKDLHDFSSKQKNKKPVNSQTDPESYDSGVNLGSQEIRDPAFNTGIITNTDIKTEYLNSIAYIEKIGPLVSIYEAFNSDLNKETVKLDILLSVIKFTINELNLDSFSIPHIIPSLLRSVIRKQGFKEPQILEMKINEIIYVAKKDIVGKIIILLARVIASQDMLILTSSPTGERLYFELLYNDFWGKLEYLPELSLLEYIAKVAQTETTEPAKQEKEKLYKNAGKLSDLLYGK